MSWQAVSMAMKHRVGTPTRKAILLVIAEHCNADGENCTARYSTIADEAEVGLRSVKRAVPEMLAAGVLIGEPGRLGVAMERDIHMTNGATQAPKRGHSGTTSTGEAVPPRHHAVPPRHREGATVAPPSEPVQNQSSTGPRAADAATDSNPDFIAFWSTYPKRADKGHARRAWRTAIRKATPAEIIAGAERYRDDPTRNPKYTANPATWLNGERWNDEAGSAPAKRAIRDAPFGTTVDFDGVQLDVRALR